MRRASHLGSFLALALGACQAPPEGPGPRCPVAESGRTGFVEVAGGRLYREELGQGPALVVVHGDTHHGLFHPVIDALADERRVVFFDRRGFGRSQLQEVPRADPVSVEVADLERLRADLGLERMDLLALSAGGPVALEYARLYPERVGRLVLVSTYADDSARVRLAYAELTPLMEERRRRISEAALELSPLDQEVREFLILPHPHHHRQIPRGVVAFWARERCLDATWPADQVGLRTGAGSGYAGLERLAEVLTPTLVIAGRHDAITPLAHARVLAETLPDARLFVLEESGHLAFADEPQAFLEVVRVFLDGG